MSREEVNQATMTENNFTSMEDIFGKNACPITQRVILVSPAPSSIHELVRDLSEGCFDVMVFHHMEQAMRNALAADLLIFDLTDYDEADDASVIRSFLMQDFGDTPSLILIKESMLALGDSGLMNRELLVWPSRPGEVVYHAQRIIRSGNGRSPSSLLLAGTSPAIFKDLWIDRKKMAIYRSGVNIELTKTEYELLITLIEHEGSVLSREELLAKVWGTSFLGGSNTIDAHIKSLRKKLGDRAADPMYIATVRGVGYRLAD